MLTCRDASSSRLTKLSVSAVNVMKRTHRWIGGKGVPSSRAS